MYSLHFFQPCYVRVASSIETLHCLLLSANLYVMPANNAINSDVRKCGNYKTNDSKDAYKNTMYYPFQRPKPDTKKLINYIIIKVY